MTSTDRQLSQQVQQRLQQQLPNANINVTASQGTVTLQGSVQEQQPDAAGGADRQVDPGRPEHPEQPHRGRPGQLSTRLSATSPGRKDRRQQQDTGTGISGDAQCIQMFKQGLTDQNLQSMAQNVYVTCHEGKMALYGYVKSDDEKDQLEKVTKKVPGIKEVDNNLIARKEGWKQKSDSEIQEDVESQLWWSPYVDSDKINVSVQNGTVTLSGQADDWDAMRAAVKNAFDGGAKRVRSQIQYGQSGQRTGASDEGTTTRQYRSRSSGEEYGSSGQRSGTSEGEGDHPSGIDRSSDR